MFNLKRYRRSFDDSGRRKILLEAVVLHDAGQAILVDLSGHHTWVPKKTVAEALTFEGIKAERSSELMPRSECDFLWLYRNDALFHQIVTMTQRLMAKANHPSNSEVPA